MLFIFGALGTLKAWLGSNLSTGLSVLLDLLDPESDEFDSVILSSIIGSRYGFNSFSGSGSIICSCLGFTIGSGLGSFTSSISGI